MVKVWLIAFSPASDCTCRLAWPRGLAREAPNRTDRDIPGTRWFPQTGRGRLDPAIEVWFRRGVEGLTHGDHAATIVTYCLADCWMSWNAAKWLDEWGYGHFLWFATGADGWRDASTPHAVDAGALALVQALCVAARRQRGRARRGLRDRFGHQMMIG